MAALLNDGLEAMVEGGAGLFDLYPVHMVHGPHYSILQLLLGDVWAVVNLLQNAPEIIVQWVKVRAGGWPEVWRPVAGSCWYNQAWVVQAICAGVESCWKAYGLSPATPTIQGLTTVSRTLM